MEKRVLEATLEIRATEGQPPKIVGYAAKFNTRSNPIAGMFLETIAPGAFTRTLKEGKINVRALYNHGLRGGMPLGTSKAGTLRMAEDETGLRVEIDPPDTQFARDLMECMKRGDINKMSFAFNTVSDKWNRENGMDLRTLEDVDLYDVSVVDDPAYEDTEASVRCYQERLSELERMKIRLDMVSRL